MMVYNEKSKIQGRSGRLRVAAIDLGDARTGVALSDILGKQAGEAIVIEEWNKERLCKKMAELFAEKGVTKVAVGHPVNMDGTKGKKAEEAKAFAEMLAAETSLSVTLWDERRTTVEAHQILLFAGKNAKKRKKTVDAVAATLILEGYLAFLAKEKGGEKL
jgi:putative Holliday junction resolvase